MQLLQKSGHGQQTCYLGDLETDERFLSFARQLLELVLPPKCVAVGGEGLGVDQFHRAATARVASAAASVVDRLARLRVARVTRVERAIGAPKDVNVMKRLVHSGRTAASILSVLGGAGGRGSRASRPPETYPKPG